MNRGKLPSKELTTNPICLGLMSVCLESQVWILLLLFTIESKYFALEFNLFYSYLDFSDEYVCYFERENRRIQTEKLQWGQTFYEVTIYIYILYARHYNLRFVFFLPHFSLRFIIKSGLYCREVSTSYMILFSSKVATKK